MVATYNITCPHCRHTFTNQVIRRHGVIRCGRCGKPFNI